MSVLAFLPDILEGEFWSGGRDLNLRQSGVCTLDRLNDAHHTGRRLQRLRQPRQLLGWLGSSTKLSYLPTDHINVKNTIYAFRYASTNCYVYLRFWTMLSFWLFFVGAEFHVTNKIKCLLESCPAERVRAPLGPRKCARQSRRARPNTRPG